MIAFAKCKRSTLHAGGSALSCFEVVNWFLRCVTARPALTVQRRLLTAKAAENATGKEAGLAEADKKDLQADIVFKPFEEVICYRLPPDCCVVCMCWSSLQLDTP